MTNGLMKAFYTWRSAMHRMLPKRHSGAQRTYDDDGGGPEDSFHVTSQSPCSVGGRLRDRELRSSFRPQACEDRVALAQQSLRAVWPHRSPQATVAKAWGCGAVGRRLTSTSHVAVFQATFAAALGDMVRKAVSAVAVSAPLRAVRLMVGDLGTMHHNTTCAESRPAMRGQFLWCAPIPALYVLLLWRARAQKRSARPDAPNLA